MPAGAVERQILYGGADLRRIDSGTQAQGILGPVRLHLRRRQGWPQKTRGGEKTHKQSHRGTLRMRLRTVNRAADEMAGLHGGSMALGGHSAMSPFEFSCAGERLEALPSGALHWPARRLLAVADLHLE